MQREKHEHATGNEEVSRPGDKVRVRHGEYKGQRAVIESTTGPDLLIRIDTGELTRVVAESLTNYSLAARRAWTVMPKKAGRPAGRTPQKKVVTMRIRADLWERLQAAVAAGLITSRELAINQWIEEALESLEIR